jgi:hypothetical protein
MDTPKQNNEPNDEPNNEQYPESSDEDGCHYEYGQNGHGFCFLCNAKIQGPGYIFTQWKEHYERDYYFVACSAYSCPSGMRADNGICKSKCRSCSRQYIHNRYDNDYCPECPGESITEEFRRLEQERVKAKTSS